MSLQSNWRQSPNRTGPSAHRMPVAMRSTAALFNTSRRKRGSRILDSRIRIAFARSPHRFSPPEPGCLVSGASVSKFARTDGYPEFGDTIVARSLDGTAEPRDRTRSALGTSSRIEGLTAHSHFALSAGGEVELVYLLVCCAALLDDRSYRDVLFQPGHGARNAGRRLAIGRGGRRRRVRPFGEVRESVWFRRRDRVLPPKTRSREPSRCRRIRACALGGVAVANCFVDAAMLVESPRGRGWARAPRGREPSCRRRCALSGPAPTRRNSGCSTPRRWRHGTRNPRLRDADGCGWRHA